MKEKKNGRKRVTAIIAVAAGAALLIGGSTYALWSATAGMDGGKITSGDLNLEAGDVSAYDVSYDRQDSVPVTDGTNNLIFNAKENLDGDTVIVNGGKDGVTMTGHDIDLNSWLITPGDTAAVLFPYTVTLKGDNLVAQLTINAGNLGKSNPNMEYYYAIFGEDGQQIGTTNPIAKENGLPVALFQANGAGQQSGKDDLDPETGVEVPMVNTDGTVSVTVAVFGYFKESTPDRNYVTGTADGVSLVCDSNNMEAGQPTTCEDDLASLSATLTQVRTGTTFFPSASPSAEPTTEG